MYYNQNDYAHVPYPAPGYEGATLKSSGCGVCCAAMVAEGLAGANFTPHEAARLALESGARVSGGTDMARLGRALEGRFGLSLAADTRLSALRACLASGGWAVANAGGDRSGYTGLFSNAGHYVAVRGTAADGRLIVWDPGYYAGKFDRPGRAGKVRVAGDDLHVAPEELDRDCQNRSPRYYLFTRPGPSPWAREAWERAAAAGLLDGTGPREPLTREQLALVLQRLGLLEPGR